MREAGVGALPIWHGVFRCPTREVCSCQMSPLLGFSMLTLRICQATFAQRENQGLELFDSHVFIISILIKSAHITQLLAKVSKLKDIHCV